ncbi:MAG: single-stranded DNA-binding protein [Candidatus Margulisiibacteriota bacterium]
MANLNRIILVGRLTSDPETRSTMEGLPMAKFRLAVDRPQNGADLIDIVAWRRVAEVSGEHLKKGSLALVEGRIQIRSFEDQSGQRRWVTEVVAKNVTMLEKSRVEEVPATSDSQLAADEEQVDDIDLASDLPF